MQCRCVCRFVPLSIAISNDVTIDITRYDVTDVSDVWVFDGIDNRIVRVFAPIELGLFTSLKFLKAEVSHTGRRQTSIERRVFARIYMTKHFRQGAFSRLTEVSDPD